MGAELIFAYGGLALFGAAAVVAVFMSRND